MGGRVSSPLNSCAYEAENSVAEVQECQKRVIAPIAARAGKGIDCRRQPAGHQILILKLSLEGNQRDGAKCLTPRGKYRIGYSAP